MKIHVPKIRVPKEFTSIPSYNSHEQYEMSLELLFKMAEILPFEIYEEYSNGDKIYLDIRDPDMFQSNKEKIIETIVKKYKLNPRRTFMLHIWDDLVLDNLRNSRNTNKWKRKKLIQLSTIEPCNIHKLETILYRDDNPYFFSIFWLLFHRGIEIPRDIFLQYSEYHFNECSEFRYEVGRDFCEQFISYPIDFVRVVLLTLNRFIPWEMSMLVLQQLEYLTYGKNKKIGVDTPSLLDTDRLRLTSYYKEEL